MPYIFSNSLHSPSVWENPLGPSATEAVRHSPFLYDPFALFLFFLQRSSTAPTSPFALFITLQYDPGVSAYYCYGLPASLRRWELRRPLLSEAWAPTTCSNSLERLASPSQSHVAHSRPSGFPPLPLPTFEEISETMMRARTTSNFIIRMPISRTAAERKRRRDTCHRIYTWSELRRPVS